MSASESHRNNAGANLQILFDSIKNGGIFHWVDSPDRFLPYSTPVSPPLKQANHQLTSADGSDVLSRAAADVPNASRRSCATTPFWRWWLEGSPAESWMKLCKAAWLTYTVFNTVTSKAFSLTGFVLISADGSCRYNGWVLMVEGWTERRCRLESRPAEECWSQQNIL